MKAKIVWYSGLVQGVGFRMRTAMIARDYPVAGWVKNIPDGGVQLYVEGSIEAVDAFLVAIREKWKGYIDDELIEEKMSDGKLKGFEVRP